MKKGLLILISALFSMNVLAGPIVVDFEGYVLHLEKEDQKHEFAQNVDIAAGDSVSLSLEFNEYTDYTQQYTNLQIGYSIDIAGYTWEDTGTYFLSQNETGPDAVDVFFAFGSPQTDTTDTQLGYFTSVLNVNDIDSMLTGGDFDLFSSLGTMIFGIDNDDFGAKIQFEAPIAVVDVPEPGTLALLSFGLISLVASRRRKSS